jgi:hypothetical protein
MKKRQRTNGSLPLQFAAASGTPADPLGAKKRSIRPDDCMTPRAKWFTRGLRIAADTAGVALVANQR